MLRRIRLGGDVPTTLPELLPPLHAASARQSPAKVHRNGDLPIAASSEGTRAARPSAHQYFPWAIVPQIYDYWRGFARSFYRVSFHHVVLRRTSEWFAGERGRRRLHVRGLRAENTGASSLA